MKNEVLKLVKEILSEYNVICDIDDYGDAFFIRYEKECECGTLTYLIYIGENDVDVQAEIPLNVDECIWQLPLAYAYVNAANRQDAFNCCKFTVEKSLYSRSKYLKVSHASIPHLLALYNRESSTYGVRFAIDSVEFSMKRGFSRIMKGLSSIAQKYNKPI